MLHQTFGMKICKIKEKFPNIPTRTVSCHAKLCAKDETVNKRKNNKGRPRKLLARDCRKIKLTVQNLRVHDNPNFSASKLHSVTGLQAQCSTRTINRELKRMKFQYLNTRQKGIMNGNDHKLRLAFARKCIRKIGPELWLSRVTMYYDGVSFYHKVNPFNEAIAPREKIWRARGEGLEMTAKGKKEGNNGRCVRMFVAISHGKGVVMCEQWDPKVTFNGINFKEFVRTHFPSAIERSSN